MKALRAISVLLVLGLFALPAQASEIAGREEIRWYFKKNSEHKQPKLEGKLNIIKKYNGIYIDANYGDDCNEKKLYLTFDFGYENGNVEKIADVLKENNVKGTFFILENPVIRNTELIKRLACDGNLICNHTAKHKDMSKVAVKEEFARELNKLEDIYRQYTGFELAKYYRPPEGKFTESNLKHASELGYTTVFWSFAYADWDNNNQLSPEIAYNKIMDNLHNGAVILLHPTSATNAVILDRVIKDCKRLGYTFDTIDKITIKT